MEDIATVRREVGKLIAQGKTHKAFEVLSRFQLTETDKELIILNGQYNRVQEEVRLNVISKDEADRKINQINLALLALSEKLGQPKKTAGIAGLDQPKNRWWLLLFIPVLLIGGIYLWPTPENDTKEEESSVETEEGGDTLGTDQGVSPGTLAPPITAIEEERPTYPNPLDDRELLAFFPFERSVDSHDRKFKHQNLSVIYSYEKGHDGASLSAVHFDGSVGGIVFDTLFLPIDQQHYAYSFWVRPDSSEEKRQAIVGQFSTELGKLVSNNHYVAIENAKNAVFVDEYHPMTHDTLKDDYGFISFEEWNHVVIVVNGTTEKVYVNNKLANIENTENFFVKSTFGQPNKFVIGGRPKFTKRPKPGESEKQVYKEESLHGFLDDLFIFKSVIDSAMVEALYHFRYKQE